MPPNLKFKNLELLHFEEKKKKSFFLLRGRKPQLLDDEKEKIRKKKQVEPCDIVIEYDKNVWLAYKKVMTVVAAVAPAPN